MWQVIVPDQLLTLGLNPPYPEPSAIPYDRTIHSGNMPSESLLKDHTSLLLEYEDQYRLSRGDERKDIIERIAKDVLAGSDGGQSSVDSKQLSRVCS
jgi:hypothetical protein